jgi:hypothetical protein
MNKPKQVTTDPFELLGAAARQVVGSEPQPPNGEAISQTQQAQPVAEKELAEKLKLQGQRQLQALEAEMAEIRRARDQQKHQDLVAQEQAQPEALKPLVVPTSRPDRKFAGEGLGAKRQQTHVEKPLPPSG